MNESELRASVRAFERVIEAGEQINEKTGTQLALVLGTFFAMWCAFKVRMRLETCSDDEVEGRAGSVVPERQSIEFGTLPRSNAIHNDTEKLIVAAVSKDESGVLSTLRRMGVLDLCPEPSQQLTRMEFVARSARGRAQLIPFVELSLFATELGHYERASKYVMEAHSFSPGAYELYNLCIVEGLIAMNAGQYREALQFLEKSINACEHDEYASLGCGVRPLNLTLTEKLLDKGQRVEVLRHLLRCKNVWRSLGAQIDVWISRIESGGRPNFEESQILRGMNEPAFRLLMQYARARALEEGTSSEAPKSTLPLSPDEIVARREKLREAYKRFKDSLGGGRVGPDDA